MLKKKLLQKLYYDKKLSMWDIARVISVTPPTVIYWMKKHGLKRRSNSECAYVKQNPNGDPFRIKIKLTKNDKELLLCGFMLYWAEGSRKNKHTIQMANLDHRLISLFIKFLKRICRVKEEKVCLNIQLYRRFDKEITRNYWSRILKVPRRFISVNIHSDTRSKPNSQWSKYGIARIEIRNVKLKRWIDSALENYLAKWV
ncbi:MAG: hypothetical protein ABIG31_00655 [Candidatus Omnitrophota bacterium]